MGFGRTALLFVVMTALLVAVGWIAGSLFANDPLSGMTLFLLIALGLNVFSYFFSDKIVLRMYRARIVSPQDEPRLHSVVDALAARMGMPKPRVAVVPGRTPNAFATGRNPRNAVVAATEGILDLLDDRELAGVLAHELAHVRNRDVLTSTIAATLAGAITFAGRTLLFTGGGNRDRGGGPLALVVALLAPLGALLIQLGIGRGREFSADEDGAHAGGDPLALASALEKLEAYNRAAPMRGGSPATASLFIVNPFRGFSLGSLFSTHPPTHERVRRLRRMAGMP